jgi:hypothetical protein
MKDFSELPAYNRLQQEWMQNLLYPFVLDMTYADVSPTVSMPGQCGDDFLQRSIKTCCFISRPILYSSFLLSVACI